MGLVKLYLYQIFLIPDSRKKVGVRKLAQSLLTCNGSWNYFPGRQQKIVSLIPWTMDHIAPRPVERSTGPEKFIPSFLPTFLPSSLLLLDKIPKYF